MSYTAWEKMCSRNKALYDIAAPEQPADYSKRRSIGALEKECLRFIRSSCEELRFDPARADLTDRDGCSAAPGQIPYNMQMDTDRLCLENAIHRFMQSGVAQDAFDVYFCFLEMFFGNYARSRKMIEMLAEFESNASVLLMKHRDHYSHSVYVFVLGMAIYQCNAQFRAAYRAAYGLSNERAAAHHYIRSWGTAALFHDIGYPFELPFAQVKNYFGENAVNVPFVVYQGMEDYLKLDEQQAEDYAALLGQPLSAPDINEVMSILAARRLGADYGFTAQGLCSETLKKRPEAPKGRMDHGYFSAILLLKWLQDTQGIEKLSQGDLDAVGAVLLHNSLFKYTIHDNHPRPLRMEQYPLAYMLMLCDELQCWDRTSYGQNSRQELHAMWCDFKFSDNTIKAQYLFDKQFAASEKKSGGSYAKMQGEPGEFVSDIEKFICINCEDAPQLEVETKFAKNNRQTRLYLSGSSFLHLYNFAIALNGRYQSGGAEAVSTDTLDEDFDRLSLEYKLSNILQAKAFARHLEAIGCFYTDRPVEYEMLDRFTKAQMDVLGPLEHDRWRQEKLSMGWQLGSAYLKAENKKQVRELTRTHHLIIEEYDELGAVEQAKDTAPMNYMLKLVDKFDGLRIYRV